MANLVMGIIVVCLGCLAIGISLDTGNGISMGWRNEWHFRIPFCALGVAVVLMGILGGLGYL
jgi:hypothetical protein